MRDVDKLNSRDGTLDIVNLVAGFILFIAPWLLSFTATAAAAWSGWIAGALIVIAAVWAFFDPARWQGWAMGILGIWAIIAPWLLGFSGLAGAMYLHVIAGLVVAVIAAYELFATNGNASHA